MEQTIQIYELPNGRRPFSEWLSNLKDVRGRAKIRTRLTRVELGNFGDCKSVGEGVFELRIPHGPGYRVYFGREGNSIVLLLCGGDKASQSADVEKAKRLWKEFSHG